MDKFEGTYKTFSVSIEEWFHEYEKPVNGTIYENPYMVIGFHDGDGGTAGEFILAFTEFGIEIEIIQTAFEAFFRMPDLHELLLHAEINNENPTINEFALKLLERGYTDTTSRIREE